jgi:hypothetical protein
MEQTFTPPAAQPEVPPEPPMSLVGRLCNIFAAPADVYDEVAARPVEGANWLVPALLIITVSLLGLWLILSQESIRHQITDITDKAIEKQAQASHMSEQQAEQARQMGEKWATIGPVVGGVFLSLFSAFGTPFVWGLILWLVGDKALKGGFPYMKAVEVVGLANMIVVLDAVLRTLLVVATGNLYASASAAMLVKNFDGQNPLHMLLIYVNIMTFWVLAVRAVGMARLARTSFIKAAVWVFGIWIAYNSFFYALSVGLQTLAKRAAHQS